MVEYQTKRHWTFPLNWKHLENGEMYYKGKSSPKAFTAGGGEGVNSIKRKCRDHIFRLDTVFKLYNIFRNIFTKYIFVVFLNKYQNISWKTVKLKISLWETHECK